MQDTPDPVILSVPVYRNQMPCLYEPLTSVKQAYRPYIYMQEYYFWKTLEKLKAIYRINQSHREQPNNDVHVFRGTCFCFCLIFCFCFFFRGGVTKSLVQVLDCISLFAFVCKFGITIWLIASSCKRNDTSLNTCLLVHNKYQTVQRLVA